MRKERSTATATKSDELSQLWVASLVVHGICFDEVLQTLFRVRKRINGIMLTQALIGLTKNEWVEVRVPSDCLCSFDSSLLRTPGQSMKLF